MLQVESKFNDLGDAHFISLESNGSAKVAKAPIDRLIQNEARTLEPVPYISLDRNTLKVDFHCPLKYGYLTEDNQFMGFLTNPGKAGPNGQTIGQFVQEFKDVDGFTLRYKQRRVTMFT